MKKVLISTCFILCNLCIVYSQYLYDLKEFTFQMPSAIQQYIDNYFSTGNGLNPYDYDQVKADAFFTSPSGKQIKISGFYFEEQKKDVNHDDGAYTSAESIIPTGIKSWKIRFTPTEVGTWNYSINVYDIPHRYVATVLSGSFICSSNPNAGSRNAKGFIRQANARYLKYEIGQPYYPIGNSCPWFAGDFWDQPEKGTNEMRKYMDEMKTNGINFFRLEINYFGGINLYGPDYTMGYLQNPGSILNNNSPVNYDQFNQHDSWQLDYILNYANTNGIDLWLALFSHSAFGANGNYSVGENSANSSCIDYGLQYTDPDSNKVTFIKTGNCGEQPYTNCNWAKVNPFNYYMEKGHLKKSSNRGSCKTPYDFFNISNTEAIRVQRNLFRYIIARWGYATNIMAFELVDEANFIGFNKKDNYPYWQDVVLPDFYNNYVAWNKKTYDFIKSIDNNNHLITSALGNDAIIDPQYADIDRKMDFIQSHLYILTAVADPEFDFQDRTNKNLSTFTGKPYIVSETGYWPNINDDPKLYELHNMLWGTLFNGSFGPASFWTHSDLSRMSVVQDYIGISNFSKKLPQLSEQYSPHTTATYNGLRVYYLHSSEGDQFYGWTQDYDYLYSHMTSYLKTFPSSKPSVASIKNNLTLNVGYNSKFEVKWYNTNTGVCSVNDLQYILAQNNQLNISIPADLLNTDYADAGFAISCKPSTGWVEKLTCPTQVNQLLQGSELAIDNNGYFYYINKDRQICGLWKELN
jgi:hypothetical protein